MRKLLIIFLLLPSVQLFGQTKPKQSTSHSYDLLYGYNLLTHGIKGQFNTTSNFQFSLPVKFIGIGGSSGSNTFEWKGFKGKKKIFSMAQNAYFQYYIPQTIRIDTLTFKTTGFSFNLGFGKALHSKNHHSNLIGYFGFNIGRLVLKSKEFNKQQNVFLNPKIGIQPKFIFGAFAVSLISEYQIDLLNSSWKNASFKSDANFKLARFDHSALSFALCVGYHIHY